MPICVPIKDLKDTSKFTNTVLSATEPVVVTKNGKESFIAMSPAQYEGLRLEAARSRLYQILDDREAQITAGNVHEAEQTADYLKTRYGL